MKYLIGAEFTKNFSEDSSTPFFDYKYYLYITSTKLVVAIFMVGIIASINMSNDELNY